MALRPALPSDAAELAALLADNRAFLAPWEPTRPDAWFTAAGQRTVLEEAARARAHDRSHPFVILGEADEIVGRITISNVVRGAGQYATLGYWVSRHCNGRGVATGAVADAVAVGFGELNLHRLEAGTLVHNVASQTVLERNGFTRYGLAPGLVRIDGRWQDHVLFQRLNPDWRDVG